MFLRDPPPTGMLRRAPPLVHEGTLAAALAPPTQSFSETELSNARSEFADLTDAGFKLDWLKTKFDEVTLVCKISNKVQELEKHIKNLKAELEMEKVRSAARFLSLEQSLLNLSSEMNKKRKLSPE
ncbi:unnamed protein product [Microthlaspi erraticum]|uniref:MATH domain-containing protein n=1 Tax=Microthlaspi erraticum TaxID=1685480 RepID=A0A6D2KX62_9BRAS|nr:unnamed protein product [Microthlaspi erraticum]